jgi:hypothetical protein
VKRIEVEISLSVSDYLGRLTKAPDGHLGMPGHDAAFMLASDDVEGAMSAAKEHAFYELPAADAEQVVAVGATYIETDSSNPSHACAHYRVALDVPEHLADEVERAFSAERGDTPTP